MNTGAPQYDELDACLNSYDSGMSAAECHGVVCGLLSAQPEIDDQALGQQLLSGEFNAAPEDETVVVHANDLAMFQRLVAGTIEQMDDPELSFMPMLPDDEGSVGDRAIALGQWAEGYLFGLSLGGIKEFSGFSEDLQGFSKDLVNMCSLEVDGADDEENEQAMFEVVEYLRMGVLMVRDEVVPPELSKIDVDDEASVTLH